LKSAARHGYDAVVTDLDSLDAYAIAEAVRAGEVSPVALVDQSLARIEEVNPEVNAFTVTFAERAREDARRIELAVQRGEDVGPLAGVPISIKDHIWMKGELATNGSRALESFRPDVDAVPVARIKQSGAVIVGKTNNPEFCYRGYTDNPLWGTTRNPWNLERTPGGSSGGAGAAVAARMTPLSVGTDGGGSVRIPAAFCGVVGLKPTFGVVPKLPGFSGWPTLSVDGPLTRSVRDAALLLQVMAGTHSADPLSYPAPRHEYLAAALGDAGLSGLRVAWSVDMGIAPVEPDVRAAFLRAVETFAETGCDLVEAHPQADHPVSIWNTIATVEGYASEGPLLERFESLMAPDTVEIVRAGEAVSGREYMDAQLERLAYTRVWLEFFDEFDLLLTPMMQMTAFPVGVAAPTQIDGRPVDPFFDDWCHLCYPANLTGQPAISLPNGLGDDGLPVAIQITGRRFEDDTVLAAAAAWERLAPWAEARPPALTGIGPR
jgi:Asp-tRNA(Asn)/Glu-tRNA(Gln) amidotransferase A subunit family amidase